MASTRIVTGTLMAVLDFYGTEEAVFVVQQKLDLDKIVHHTEFSYAAYIYDGDEDSAWEIISQLHVIEVKKHDRCIKCGNILTPEDPNSYHERCAA